MNTTEFIELQKKLGLTILDTKKHHWVIMGNKYSVITPSLETSTPSKDEISSLFKKGSKAVTFIVDNKETNSYEYIFEGNDYTIEVFKSKIRNQIRKGLKSCEVKKTSLKDIQKDGLLINREILSKHQRDVEYLTDEKLWFDYSQTLLEAKDVFTYGAYVEDTLAGYLFFIKVNKKYYVYHPYTTRKYSKQAPMNTLLFTAINDFIKKDGNVAVSYGLASFFEKQGLDHFKKGMLFVEKPVARVIAFSFPKNILFNDVISKIVNFIPKNNRTEKIKSKYNSLYNGYKLYKKYITRN